ncbi:MAG: hypothetical protein IJ546_10250 [Prevotella sp.]|nr:hypothetical protein [Prevotella sp.]
MNYLEAFNKKGKKISGKIWQYKKKLVPLHPHFRGSACRLPEKGTPRKFG